MPLRSLSRPTAFAALLGAALIGAACAAAEAPSGRGSGVLALERLDGTSTRPLVEARRPAVCLVLVRIDCPISNRYAPELGRLAEEFAETADWWLVYCDADETAAAIRAHAAAHEYPFEPLRDPEHALAALAGVSVTPEVAVFGPDRRLVYAGRIDDRQVEFGVTRPAPTERELADVLAALRRGERLEFRRVEAVGCPLPEPAP